LLEKDSHFLEVLDDFLIEFNDIFGETDKVRTATTKIRSLRQGSCPVSVYAIDFHQLAYDIDWDDNAFISAFRWRIQNDVKYLLLNLSDPLN
jgi:hypothetical protein